MNKILCLTLLCVAAASAKTKTVKSAQTAAPLERSGFGIGTHSNHPEVLTVSHGHGHGHGGGGGGGGHGGGGGGHGGGWGGGDVSGGYGTESPALADIVALVLNLLVLAAFGGLVYLLLSPLLSGGGDEGWGRSSSPYYEAFKDGGVLSRVLNSIDYVEPTFAVMKISGDGCRKRVACQMEQASARNKVFNYATSFFRKRMRSMDLYRDAMVSGDKQEDCVAAYPDCTFTLVDKVGKWVGTN